MIGVSYNIADIDASKDDGSFSISDVKSSMTARLQSAAIHVPFTPSTPSNCDGRSPFS